MSVRHLCWISVLGLLFIAGCDQKFQMTFNNTTGQARDVEVAVGDGPMEPVGVVPPGGTMRQDFKFKKNQLPTQVSWQAGDVNGAITVTKGMSKKTVNIEPEGSTVVGPKEKVHKHTEKTTTTQQSHTTLEP